LYRVIWRWHFYAGMIVAPALIVVAATGALYIFKDELEAVLYPGVTYVEPAADRVSYEQQLAVARANVPTPVNVGLIQVFANPKRATGIAMAGKTFQIGYVDPYRGRYLGAIEQGGFFDIVLKLHRQLFLGTTGRIAIELTTCWAIVLAATGMYLWWPRKWNHLWGVWLPRLRRKPYVVLRDLHAVGGIYVAIIAIVISLTGLIYTYAWGSGFQYASQRTEAYDMFSKPMLCKSPPDAKDLPIDRFIEIGHEKMPGKTLNVWFPRGPNAVYMVFGSSDYGPSVHEMLFIDRATGETPGRSPHQSGQAAVLVGEVELSTARRLGPGAHIENPMARDLRGPDDAAGDGPVDVVGASPDRQTGPASPHRCQPPALASRHNYGDQHFATDAGRLGGGGAGARPTRVAIAARNGLTANAI
jgi:uncharacterized iron-regulated membrane protein